MRKADYEQPATPVKRTPTKEDDKNMYTPTTTHAVDRFRKCNSAPADLYKVYHSPTNTSNRSLYWANNATTTQNLRELTPREKEIIKNKVQAMRGKLAADRSIYRTTKPYRDDGQQSPGSSTSSSEDGEVMQFNLPEHEQTVTVGYRFLNTRHGQLSPVTIPLDRYLKQQNRTNQRSTADANSRENDFRYGAKANDASQRRNVKFENTRSTNTGNDTDDVLHLYTNIDFDSEYETTSSKNNGGRTMGKLPITEPKSILKSKVNVNQDYDDTNTKRYTTTFRPNIVRQRTILDPTEKLQGSKNYVVWAEKIKRILLADGVDDYVTKKLEEINDEPVIRDRINAAVYELIHTNLIPEIQPLITNIPRALDAWKKLEKSYTSNSVDEIVEASINSANSHLI